VHRDLSLGAGGSQGLPATTTLTQSGNVFASVGSNVSVCNGIRKASSIRQRWDGQTFTAGGVFDSHNFYVTDDTNGEISEYDSSKSPATVRQRPLNPLS
jgi:hypothetical protein